MPQLVDDQVRDAAFAVRDLLATHKDSEDLINIGAYKRGSNPRIDRAIEKIDSINVFLRQRAEEPSQLGTTQDALHALVR
jgi:flagellum-specific ATP synthase